ncbi:MAG TPA: M15 family metallopeptidase [Spirochaetales bacterium]|nr:M15 family metallopeptidase [Spirochaetales bacterium]
MNKHRRIVLSALVGLLIVVVLVLVFAVLPGLSGEHNRSGFLAQDTNRMPPRLHAEIAVLKAAYPSITIASTFDSQIGDWKITLTKGDSTKDLYWAEGRYLPKELLGSKDNYRTLIFYIPKKPEDPATFTKDQIEKIREFGSSESRESGPISPTYFFEIIYDTSSREDLEAHIVKTKFLGRQVNVHELIVEPLNRVERQIFAASQTDREAHEFIQSISSIDGYSWRQIRDTSGMSFHSMGLAIDILPRGWQNKVVYWNWEKNKGKDDWMLIPLEGRWAPPDLVVDMFEKEGFVWGGKWTVWDNMHFEYRPEMILGREISVKD